MTRHRRLSPTCSKLGKQRLSAILLCAALLASAGLARGDEPGFEGSGSAPVGDDVVRARERSLKDAMQRVLEQAVAQAAPEARGRLYQVSARAREYVTTYRMVDESEADGQFRVRIQAQVDLPRLLRDLQVPAGVQKAAPRSLILLCADSQADPEGPGLLRAALAPYGPVLPGACPALDNAAEVTQAMVAAGAQVAVVERIVPGGPAGEVRGTQPSLYGAAATARLSLYRSAGPPAEESRESFGFAESETGAQVAARRSASQGALVGLLPRLWPPGGGEATSGVAVTVEGIAGYGDYQRLIKVFGALPGVGRVAPRGFGAGLKGLRAEVFLETPTPASTLGASLGRTPIPGLRLQVVPESPGKLRVLVAPEDVLPLPPTPSSMNGASLRFALPKNGASLRFALPKNGASLRFALPKEAS